jgi:tetratricopeptide (TPR) repeat protein
MPDDRWNHVADELARYAPGVHILGPRAGINAVASLPPVLASFYLQHNGAELFHQTLVLRPADKLERGGDRWLVGEIGRDEIWVDDADAVWRVESDSGDAIHEGTRFDRWLDGWIEAEGVLYATDGEFLDFAVEEHGEELTPAATLERERRAHKRDRKAAGPWWRLARALARIGDPERARDELEHLVAEHPRFAWAWFDLARLSEQLGQTEGAIDEARAAAEADPDYEHAPYFYAYAAKLAAAANDEPQRAELAARALAADPDLARTQREAATTTLAEGNPDTARELLHITLALTPRDLEALALLKKLDESPPVTR